MPYNKEASEQFRKKYSLTVSSARSRLIKSIMFALLKESDQHYCYRCGEELELNSFTIEHVKPWAYQEDAWELYFDLSNIAFSHSKCNSAHTRRYTKHAIAHRVKHFGATMTDPTNKTRKCSHCKTWKDFGLFVKNRSKTHGIAHICRKCRSIVRKKERAKKKLDTRND